LGYGALRGFNALGSVPVRAYNAGTDVVASVAPGDVFHGIRSDGQRETGSNAYLAWDAAGAAAYSAANPVDTTVALHSDAVQFTVDLASGEKHAAAAVGSGIAGAVSAPLGGPVVSRLGRLLPERTPANDGSAPTTVVESADGTLALQQALPGRSIYVDSRGNAIVANAELPTNFRGERIVVPDGHVASALDPDLDAPPIVERGPFTAAQRQAFMRGGPGDTGIAPHHRGQIPSTYGSVIDDLPGPSHPGGNQHTVAGRHPNPSIFNRAEGGRSLRSTENRAHYREKGKRLIFDEESGMFLDPGPQ